MTPRVSERPLRILIADADPLTRRIATRVLEREGHEVSPASDSDSALDQLKGHGFDLMLVALDLPGIGGIEMAKLYRFMALGRPRMAMVALASGWTLDACARGGEAGIELFLAKPLIPRELLAAVASAVVPSEVAKVEVDDPFGIVRPLFGRTAEPTFVVDPALLDRMDEIGGPAFVAEIVEDFEAACEAELARLDESLARRSIAIMRGAGHKIDELARTIGADRLRRMGGALGAVAAAEFDRRGSDYVRQVGEEYQRVTAELQRRINAPTAVRR